MEVSGQLHALTALSPQYPLDRRLCGSQSQSTRCGEEKSLAGNRIPTVQPVAIPTELRRLLLTSWVTTKFSKTRRKIVSVSAVRNTCVPLPCKPSKSRRTWTNCLPVATRYSGYERHLTPPPPPHLTIRSSDEEPAGSTRLQLFISLKKQRFFQPTSLAIYSGVEV
jgi:hypothetical protein